MGKRIEDMDFDLDDFEGEMYESEETKIDENDDLDVGEEDLDFEFEEDESEESEGEFESEEYVEEEGELEGELTDIEGENSGIIDLEGELGGYTDYPTEDELKDESNEYEDVSEESEGEFEEEIDEYEEVESEDYNNSESEESWFDEEESEGDYEDAYNRIADEEVEDLESVYGFFDKDGNPVDARKRGTVLLDSIDIGSVIVPTRNRTEPRDITVLEENIKNFHQVSPIHVIPYGEGEYILLDGLRRLHAMINLGHDKIMAYVDDTINPHAVRPFESLVNNRLQYTFSEKFKAGRFIEQRQDGFSYDTIENMIGLKTGEYLKMLFVHRMKDIFPDIYEKVILEKLTPEQAERKINKELEKSEDENNLADAQSELGEEGAGEGKTPSSGRESEDPYNRQNKEERSILDSSLKTAVLTRDGGVCQCCGEGIGEPEVSQLMKIHHIVPVELFGPDRQDNLITLCANCHDKVHYYDEGRYKPDGELPKIRRNPLVLGNMIQELRDEAEKNGNTPIDGMEYYNESPYESYILSSYQSDFIEGAEDNVENSTRGEVHKVYSRRERDKLKNTKKDMQ